MRRSLVRNDLREMVCLRGYHGGACHLLLSELESCHAHAEGLSMLRKLEIFTARSSSIFALSITGVFLWQSYRPDAVELLNLLVPGYALFYSTVVFGR